MQVNRTEKLEDIKSFSDIVSAIYLHEYIHFLQDISTTYCFINISTVVDYIKYVNEVVINGQNRNFSVPITVRPSPNNEVFFNLNLKKKYVGGVNDATNENFKSNLITKL